MGSLSRSTKSDKKDVQATSPQGHLLKTSPRAAPVSCIMYGLNREGLTAFECLRFDWLTSPSSRHLFLASPPCPVPTSSLHLVFTLLNSLWFQLSPFLTSHPFDFFTPCPSRGNAIFLFGVRTALHEMRLNVQRSGRRIRNLASQYYPFSARSSLRISLSF